MFNTAHPKSINHINTTLQSGEELEINLTPSVKKGLPTEKGNSPQRGEIEQYDFNQFQDMQDINSSLDSFNNVSNPLPGETWINKIPSRNVELLSNEDKELLEGVI